MYMNESVYIYKAFSLDVSNNGCSVVTFFITYRFCPVSSPGFGQIPYRSSERGMNCKIMTYNNNINMNQRVFSQCFTIQLRRNL